MECMAKKRFQVKENKVIEKCPNCGNNTDFFAHSQQVCEDGCEIWISCKCGFDPTAGSIGYRMEDVWGSLGEGEIRAALSCCWNEIIEAKILEP
jgi:hypothetical protein